MKAVSKDMAETLETLRTDQEEWLELEAYEGLEGE